MNKVRNAIILAAGKGERMLPLTKNTPKPLIKIHGKPIIENTIELLLSKGIDQISIVVGYLAEKFHYLTEKYPVEIIENNNYLTSNNISSLYVARERLGNTVILDADIWIEDSEVIKTEFEYSGYTGIWTDSHSDEWIQYENNEGFLSHCSVGGDKGWILYSISYWNNEDCKKLKEDIEEAFITNKNTSIYWDDVPVFCYPEHYKLKIKKTEPNLFFEFDNIAELAAFDNSYSKYLK